MYHCALNHYVFKVSEDYKYFRDSDLYRSTELLPREYLEDIPNCKVQKLSNYGRVWSLTFHRPKKPSYTSEYEIGSCLIKCVGVDKETNFNLLDLMVLVFGTKIAFQTLFNLDYDEYIADLPGEEWRPMENLPNCEMLVGCKVSNKGRVKGYTQLETYEVLFHVYESKTAYSSISTNVDDHQKVVSLHRAVAEAFIPNPDNLPVMNHLDGNKHNNDVSNLEWCTVEDNCRHAYATGLVKIDKEAFRRGRYKGLRKVAAMQSIPVKCLETNTVYKSYSEAGRQLGIDGGYISERTRAGKICKGLHFVTV